MTAFGTALLITGSEQLLAMRAMEERRDGAIAEQPAAEVNRLAATELEDAILAEVVGASLFSSHSITIIEDVGSTPMHVVDQLVATAAAPPEELCLILIHEGGNKGKGLIDKLKKARVEVVEAKPPKPWEALRFCRNFIQQESRRHRVRLSAEAADALVESVGTDLRALTSALAQLVDDAGGEAIDPKLIRHYFAGQVEVTSFAVADAVLAGDARLAMEKLRWALDTGVSPVQVTSAMAYGFRGMGKFLDAPGNRGNPNDLARRLGLPVGRVRAYAGVAGRWNSGGVAQAMLVIARADAEVKGAATSPEYAVERMVLEVLDHRRGTRN